MKLYRALRDLDKGSRIIERGEVFAGEEFSDAALTKLEGLGKIARASTPPLEVLPGWTVRAKKLAECGIITAEEFLSMPDKSLAKAINAPATRVAEWKISLLECLRIPKPEG